LWTLQLLFSLLELGQHIWAQL